MGFFFVILF